MASRARKAKGRGHNPASGEENEGRGGVFESIPQDTSGSGPAKCKIYANATDFPLILYLISNCFLIVFMFTHVSSC